MSAADMARKAIDALNRKDLEAYKSLYVEDAVAHDPMYAEPLQGREVIAADLADFFAAFPDGQYRMSSFNFLEDAVSIGIAMVGTHTAPLKTSMGDIPPTNRSVDVRMSIQAKVNENEQIVEERRFYDPADLMKQLGHA